MTIHATIFGNLVDIVVKQQVIPCTLLVLAQEKREGEKVSSIRAYDLAEKPVYEALYSGDKFWENVDLTGPDFREKIKTEKPEFIWRVREGTHFWQKERDFEDGKHLDRYIRRLQERSI